MYQGYNFTRKSSQLESGDANPKDMFSYRCSKADTTDCEAFLHVNLAGDVLSAFIEHNHTPKSKEEIVNDFFMDSKPKPYELGILLAIIVKSRTRKKST